MSDAVAQLLTILDLERIEENIFRGRSPQVGWQRVFGGLVVAQALVAAARTVEGRTPHSLHGYFLLPGDPAVPIVYEVDRIRDGKSFTTRRCNAIQHGRAIFSLSASFQIEEAGLEHAVSMPKVPLPERRMRAITGMSIRWTGRRILRTGIRYFVFRWGWSTPMLRAWQSVSLALCMTLRGTSFSQRN